MGSKFKIKFTPAVMDYLFESGNYTQAEYTNKLTQFIVETFQLTPGCYAWRVNVKGIRGRKATNKGMADIIGAIRGQFVAIEIKSDKDKLNPDQEDFKADVLSSGGLFWEVRSWAQFHETLKEFYTSPAIISPGDGL